MDRTWELLRRGMQLFHHWELWWTLLGEENRRDGLHNPGPPGEQLKIQIIKYFKRKFVQNIILLLHLDYYTKKGGKNVKIDFKGSDRLCKVVELSMSTPASRSFEPRICAQTQDLQIFRKFSMSQMNPKEVFHNTAYSVKLPYIAGHSL